MSFKKVPRAELLRTAQDDFAVEVDKSWPKGKIIEALDESGVDFEMYLDHNPDAREKYTDVPKEVVQSPVVKTAPPVEDENQRKVLIKMERENGLYEIGKYRFTKTHPYVLVNEDDAERIILHEEGFRQATPRELQEFYS